MAELLFQIAHVRAAALSRARLIHPAHETEKHLALDDGRRVDHTPRFGILRLTLQSPDAPGRAHIRRGQRGASHQFLNTFDTNNPSIDPLKEKVPALDNGSARFNEQEPDP